MNLGPYPFSTMYKVNITCHGCTTNILNALIRLPQFSKTSDDILTKGSCKTYKDPNLQVILDFGTSAKGHELIISATTEDKLPQSEEIIKAIRRIKDSNFEPKFIGLNTPFEITVPPQLTTTFNSSLANNRAVKRARTDTEVKTPTIG